MPASEGRLAEFAAQIPVGELLPDVDQYGPAQGSPPVMRVFAADRLAGYAFVNADWVNSTGYPGHPLPILLELTTDGEITGARPMAGHEPIVQIGKGPRILMPEEATAPIVRTLGVVAHFICPDGGRLVQRA